MTRRTRRTATPARLTDQDIQSLTAEYELLKSEAAVATKKAKAIQERILEEMSKRGVETIEWTEGRVTRTAAKTVSISIDVLRELLPTRVFNKVTTRAVDKKLLAAAVQDGTVSVEVVTEASTEGENAPYIRVSHGTGD